MGAAWTPDTVQALWRSLVIRLNFFKTLIAHDSTQNSGTYMNRAATAAAAAVCPLAVSAPAAAVTAETAVTRTVRLSTAVIDNSCVC